MANNATGTTSSRFSNQEHESSSTLLHLSPYRGALRFTTRTGGFAPQSIAVVNAGEAVMLKSILLECSALGETTIPLTNGHLTQALVLNLIRQFDPELSARLHDEPGYRPYTVSPLSGGARSAAGIALQREQRCRIRLTLLDGGTIWQKLCTHYLEAGPVSVQLGSCLLQLVRIVSSPQADPAGWVSATDWQPPSAGVAGALWFSRSRTCCGEDSCKAGTGMPRHATGMRGRGCARLSRVP